MGVFFSKSTASFAASYAPTERATCKGCRKGIAKGSIRLSRDLPNNWTGDRGESTVHYHLRCGLTAVQNMRCVVPAGVRGVRWVDREHETPEPTLSGAGALKAADAKSVTRRFEASKARFMKRCAHA